MILYNVTVSLDPSIHADWLEWMRNVHIRLVRMDEKCSYS